MKKLLLIIAIIVILIIICQEKLFSQELLPATWKFKTGDNLEWAKPTFNDESWSDIKTNDVWESQGYPSYDGYAWYRTTVIIPSIFKKDAEKYGGFSLQIGKIDDADYTYFNGEFIGKTGELPPNYTGQYDTPRNYIIPVNEILWDKPNVIAVRVFDFGGGGGIYSGPVSLSVKGKSDRIRLDVTFKETDHIILEGQEVVIPITIRNDFNEKCSFQFTLEVTSDFKKAILNQSQEIKIRKHSVKEISIKIPGLEPGFYNATAKLDGEGISKMTAFSFGVNPEKIVSPTDKQPDFQNYWDRARRELAAVDPQFKVTKADSLCTSSRNVYLVEMRSLGNILVRGWYAVPVKPGKYPAILHVQGYSSTMGPPNTNDGDDFISFALNIRGHGNSRDDINPGFPGFLQFFVDDKELYIYRGAYMDCLRAMDFLFSRSEVDTTKVVVEGGSQGGALSYATAALDNKRVKLCVPAVPFLSDFRHYFLVASWPGNEFVDYVAKKPQIGWEKVYNTLSYIDIKNLAGWIKAPVLMSVGLVDVTCPPHINFAAYNQLTVPKEYKVFPFSGHGLPSEYDAFKMNWIRKNLGMK
jgi:cephalosporin-C deacetylase